MIVPEQESNTLVNHAKPKLNIGLIVDSNLSSNFAYEIAQWCQNQTNLHISHLLIQKLPPAKSRWPLVKLREYAFTFIARLENLLLKRAKISTDNTRQQLDPLIAKIITVNPVISENEQTHGFSDHELDKIDELQLDVLLMAGSGALHGRILEVARFGVITPHLCEYDALRGGPAGFWEVFYKQDYTGFAIRQQNKADEGDKDLVKGRITTQYYYSMNRVRIEQKCSHYLKKILSDIAVHRQLPDATIVMPFAGITRGNPGLVEQLNYLVQLGVRLLHRAIRSKLKKDFKWSVAYQKRDWQNLVMETAIKIPNPRNHFLADPFVISEDDKDYCFVEDYDYTTSRGHIAVYQLGEQNAECLGNVLVEPFHLSFPYMFRFESEIYMCPETSGSKQIRVYKCVSFPLRWELHSTLMEGISAVDTMLFERDGKWWMLTNIDMSSTGDHCSELCVFWAESPLSSNWTALSGNPIFIDSAKGRNAGLLFDGTNHYRVAQKQGFERYGKAFSINRIDLLEENAYVETEVRSVQADFFPGLIGTHHMHSNGKVSVFDFLEDKQIGSV